MNIKSTIILSESTAPAFRCLGIVSKASRSPSGFSLDQLLILKLYNSERLNAFNYSVCLAFRRAKFSFMNKIRSLFGMLA
jgi:hypothetical protein